MTVKSKPRTEAEIYCARKRKWRLYWLRIDVACQRLVDEFPELDLVDDAALLSLGGEPGERA